MLYEPPFTDINSDGVEKVFDNDDLIKVFKIIDSINHNAVAV